MKRLFKLIVASILAVACLCAAVSAVDVKLDGETLAFEQPPVIVEERTLVPLRAIFEALGAEVSWDDSTKTVTATRDEDTIKLTIGATTLYKNGVAHYELDVPAQIVGEGYTMVPVRAISESFGVNVDWDDTTKTVLLTTPVPEVEGAIITLADAENGLGYDFKPGHRVDSIDIVADPVNADNNVYYTNTSFVGQKSWSYIWLDTEFEAGKTYSVSYDILSGKDGAGTYVESTKTSACFQFAQSDKDDGIVRDHGLKMVDINPETWTHVELSYTVPETLIPEKGMKFGIYIDPVTEGAMCMYVDNIVVVPADVEEEPDVEPEQPVVPEEPEVEGSDDAKLDADTYTGDSRFYATSTTSSQLVVVDNPTDSSDKVFYLESNITEKDSWTYFWMKDAGFTAGQKYIVEYDVYIAEKDSHGEEVTDKVSLGNNFRFGETGIPSKDHGVATSSIVAGEWSHIILIYTVPETLDPAADMKFGVFASPKNAHCYSYYFDNFSLLPYDGAMGNGLYDSATIENAKKLESFDIDAVEGLVYDFAESYEPFNINKAFYPEIVDGHLSLTVEEKEKSDVQFGSKGYEFSAEDYNRIAIKVKFTGVDFTSTYLGLYFATEDDPKLSQSKCVETSYASARITEDGYYVLVGNLNSNEFWTGKIVELRFDPFQNVVGTALIDKVVLFKD